MKINTVAISGNLTRDAEIRTLQTGQEKIEFTLAYDEKLPNGNKQASYFRCESFSKYLIKSAPSLKSGTKVFIQGKLRRNTWEKDGKKIDFVSIYVEQIDIIANRSQAQEYSSNPITETLAAHGVQMPQQAYQSSLYDKDIPF